MQIDKSITKHKAVAIELTYDRDDPDLFNLVVRLSHKRDHAGFEFCLDVLGVEFTFSIYDIRHWDYDTGRWQEYPK